MSNDKDKQLDDFFKTELEDPVHQTVFNEKDWSALEETLDNHNKRRNLVYWLPVISGAAALLLMFLGWWIFRDNQVHVSKLQVSNLHHQANTGTSGGTIRQPMGHNQTTLATANFAGSGNHKTGGNSKAFFTLSAVGARRSLTGSQKNNRVSMLKTTPAVLYQGDTEIVSVQPAPVFEDGQTVSHTDITFLKNVSAGGIVKRSRQSEHQKDKAGIKQQAAFRPQFALSVLAAPDLNGVGSFQQSKVGTNVGLLFSAVVSKKFTISTGVLYSVKPYLTNFADYHTSYSFRISPVNVTADCRMLDIPLNLGYQVYNKGQNKLSIGTGLSSYIMLHEKYTFNYNDAYAYGPVSYTVPKSGKYVLGVLNLNASYERRLNSKVGVTVEPYMKLPLTNIGYGQVKLQTTGVAVGLKWNINSSTKQ